MDNISYNVISSIGCSTVINFYFRNENKFFLRGLLSEDSRRKRMRRNTISLQTTILAWIIEFITGFVMLINILFAIDEEYLFARIIVPLDITLCNVVIPASYILKTDDVKKVIVDRGWWRFLRKLLCFRNTRITPADNLEMHAPANADAVNIERRSPEPQNLKMEHASNIPKVDFSDDDENWWMRINLFHDDDNVDSEQEQKEPGKEKEGGEYW